MIEAEKLLGPIRDDSPTGDNLRLIAGDQTIAQVEELRREQDPEVDVSGKGKEPDWPAVVRVCEEALLEKSKDLQLAAHLAEGLAHTEGFEGLTRGLQVVTGLIDGYWNHVHPGCEDGEILEPLRARWISWLGGSQDFLRAVKSIPVAAGAGGQAMSWADYEDSLRVEEAGALGHEAAYTEMIEAGKITGEQWKASLAGVSPEQLSVLAGSVAECRGEVENLGARCGERFSADSPGLTQVRDLLEEIEAHLRARLPAAAAEPSGGDAATPAAPAAAGEGMGDGQRGAIRSRDEAYERIREVADYLRRTEPHSPSAALLDRVIRWRDMSFAELLRDVFKKKDARASVMELLGIEEPQG